MSEIRFRRFSDLRNTPSRETYVRALPTRVEQVFEAIKIEPSTDWELHEILDCPYTSVQAPRGSLVRKGLVVDTGDRRLTPNNAPAIVWGVPREHRL